MQRTHYQLPMGSMKRGGAKQGKGIKGYKQLRSGTSTAVQWLRICLAMQWTQVPSLAGELRSHTPWGNSAPMPQLRPSVAK